MQRLNLFAVCCGVLIANFGCSEDKTAAPGWPDSGPRDVRDFDVPGYDAGPDDPDALIPCDFFTDVLDVSTYNVDLAAPIGLAGGHDKIWALHYYKQTILEGFKLRSYLSNGNYTEDADLLDKQNVEALLGPASPSVATGPQNDLLIAYSAQSGGAKGFHLLKANGIWPPTPNPPAEGINPVAFGPGASVNQVQVIRLPAAPVSESYVANDVAYAAAWRDAGGALYYDVVRRGIHQAQGDHVQVSTISAPYWSLNQSGLSPVLVYSETNGDAVDLKLRQINKTTGALGEEQTVWTGRAIAEVAAIRIHIQSTLVVWTQIINDVRLEVHAAQFLDTGSIGREEIISKGADYSNGIALAGLGDFAVLTYRGGPQTDKEVRVTMLKGDASFAFEGDVYGKFVVAELGDITDVDLSPPALVTSGDDRIVALAWSEASGTGRTRLALLSCTY